MKKLDATQNAVTLLEAVRSLGGDAAAVLENGRPVAVLLPVEGADLETVALTLHPQFLAILERSKARQLAEGGVSAEEMRRRLGIDAPTPARAKGNGRKAKAKPASPPTLQ